MYYKLNVEPCVGTRSTPTRYMFGCATAKDINLQADVPFVVVGCSHVPLPGFRCNSDSHAYIYVETCWFQQSI